MVSLTNSTDQLQAQMLILLKHVSQKLMSLYSIHTVPVPVDMDKYLGYSREYTQGHVQYLYIAMSFDLYLPLTKPQLKLFTQMGVVHYCEMHT